MTEYIKPTPVRKSTVKHTLIVAEQVLLYTAIVAGLGFYAGSRYEARQTANTQAAIHDAIKAAATPIAVPAPASKS